MTRTVLLALTLAVAACAGSTGPMPPATNEIILELGQSRQLDGTRITVTLQSVDDSRCPLDAVCIWEGNGRIALGLSEAAGPEITGELNTNPRFPQALTYRYLRIELTELEPEPRSTRPVVVYRAHLRWNYMLD